MPLSALELFTNELINEIITNKKISIYIKPF